MREDLHGLLQEIRSCRYCEANLPLGPRPVLSAHPTSRIIIAGQAPGTKVHASGIPWDDASGARLRHWLGMEPEIFYDEKQIAIIPMGFCYPGKGERGDLPPRWECATLWHEKLRSHLPKVTLTLAIGQYAIRYYLGSSRKESLTQTVRHWQEYLPMGIIPLVHPSPRNLMWQRRNPWFEADYVPLVREKVWEALAGS